MSRNFASDHNNSGTAFLGDNFGPDSFHRLRNDIKRDRSFPGRNPKSDLNNKFNINPDFSERSFTPGGDRGVNSSGDFSGSSNLKGARSPERKESVDEEEDLFNTRRRFFKPHPPQEDLLEHLKEKLRKSDMFFHTPPDLDWPHHPTSNKKADEGDEWARKSFDDMRSRGPMFRMPNWMSQDDDVPSFASRMNHSPMGGMRRASDERGPWRERRSSGGSNISATSEDDVDSPFVDRLSQGSGGSSGCGGVFTPPSVPQRGAGVDHLMQSIPIRIEAEPPPGLVPNMQGRGQTNEQMQQQSGQDFVDNGQYQCDNQPVCDQLKRNPHPQCASRTTSSIESSNQEQLPRETRCSSAPPETTEPGQRRFVSKINISPQNSNAKFQNSQKFNNVAKPFVAHQKMESPQPPIAEEQGNEEIYQQPQYPSQPEPQIPQQPQPQAHPQPQPQPQHQQKQRGSIVRNIPIFFEGRDEPFVNRDSPGRSSPQQQQRSGPAQPQPQPQPQPQQSRVPPQQQPQQSRVPPQQQQQQKVPPAQSQQRVPPQNHGSQWQDPFMRGFPSRGFGFAEDDPFYGAFKEPPMSFRQQTPSQFNEKPQQFQSQENPQKFHQSPQQSQQRPEQVPVNVQKSAPPPKPEEPPKPQAPKDIKMDKITKAREVYEDLKIKVDQYTGISKDKDYLYLDEFLTRNLLQLDDIDPDGREDVRQVRRTLIRDINKTISILEAKITPAEPKNESISEEIASMQVDNPSTEGGIENTEVKVPESDSKMETDDNEKVEVISDTVQNEVVMSEEPSASNIQEQSSVVNNGEPKSDTEPVPS